MLALIDADIVCYRCAASNNIDEEGALEQTLLRADKLMSDILFATQATEYRSFLSGKNNFRYTIYPEYKANRKDTPKPIHLQAVRDFLINDWKSEVCNGYEADDALGMYQDQGELDLRLDDRVCEINYNSIICTIDKDLDMVPGLHYNFVKNIIYTVTELDAIKFFYRQLLIGDTSDNIKGIHGIGPKGASKLIDHLEFEEDMYNVVKDLYKDNERLCTNMQCLWIWH